MLSREREQEQQKYNQHPSKELIQDVAERAATMDEVEEAFPTLWAHLEECEKCRQAFAELMGLVYQKGRQDERAEETETHRTIVMAALASVLAVVLLTGGFLLWDRMSEDAAVNRVYAAMSPAVANIEVQSTGVKGSGVVFDKQGYVLTNYHVLRGAQNSQDVVVTLPGLGEVPAQLVGYDIATDLAVLNVDAPSERLTVAQFGDSDAVEVGEQVIAIGNPFGLSQSLTVGRVSAVGRQLVSNDPYVPDVKGVIQTDAAINPGNSGGPLLNTDGRVIGINTRIQSPSRGSVGVGFAVPSETALQVAREIIERGYVRRPFLGAAGRSLNPQLAQQLGLPVDQGVLVQKVHPESPAAQLNLDAGKESARTQFGNVNKGADVILSVDGQRVESQEELNRLVAEQEVGDRVQLEVLRDGERATLNTTLAERPRMGMEQALAPQSESKQPAGQ